VRAEYRFASLTRSLCRSVLIETLTLTAGWSHLDSERGLRLAWLGWGPSPVVSLLFQMRPSSRQEQIHQSIYYPALHKCATDAVTPITGRHS